MESRKAPAHARCRAAPPRRATQGATSAAQVCQLRTCLPTVRNPSRAARRGVWSPVGVATLAEVLDDGIGYPLIPSIDCTLPTLLFAFMILRVPPARRRVRHPCGPLPPGGPPADP